MCALASLLSARYAAAGPAPSTSDPTIVVKVDPNENFLLAGAALVGVVALAAAAAYGFGTAVGYHNAAHEHELEAYHEITSDDGTTGDASLAGMDQILD